MLHEKIHIHENHCIRDTRFWFYMESHNSAEHQGPVVQNIVSLTSSSSLRPQLVKLMPTM